MTEEEAEELNRFLDARLRSIQEPDIARQDDLSYRDAEGVVKRLSPRKRLALTIDALESQLALEDISTFRQARREIAAVAEGFDDVTVEVVPLPNELSDVGVSEDRFGFDELPDLSDLRQRLRALSERVRYDPGPDTDYV